MRSEYFQPPTTGSIGPLVPLGGLPLAGPGLQAASDWSAGPGVSSAAAGGWLGGLAGAGYGQGPSYGQQWVTRLLEAAEAEPGPSQWCSGGRGGRTSQLHDETQPAAGRGQGESSRPQFLRYV